MTNLLPNGSIVLLEGGNKKLMIYGRKQLLMQEENEDQDAVEGEMYDYIGVPYPEGYINPEYTYVFNHTDIVDIIFRGFENDEEAQFQNVLKAVHNQ